MSVYSTLMITESKAKSLLFDEHFGHLSYAELTERLDALLGPRLFNTYVVPDDSVHNDNDKV